MYIQNTRDDQRAMLGRLGMNSIDELFEAIPPSLRAKLALQLPPAMSEIELTRRLTDMGKRNVACDRAACFLGGGCYDHFIPAVVDVIGSRSEFYTAYTPYQAEASQGTLQAAFEFQTLICQLTGLDVANASLYEAATSVVEAVFAALGATGRAKIVVSETVHPEYRATLATYCANLKVEIVTIRSRAGTTDVDALRTAVDSATAGVVLQSPNFFGLVEPVARMAEQARDQGAVIIQAFDPISLGMLRRPGDLGADIAVAEGQPLGNAMNYGGPFLGLFACRQQFLRRIPGRIVGQTVDRNGNRAFVLTLQTREQHIRREKATSNICTNQGLMSLRAAAYLALLGKEGLRETANLCYQKAQYAAAELSKVKGINLRFGNGFFKEFVIELPERADRYPGPLLEAGFHAGVPLGRWFPDLGRCLLVAVTEKRTKQEIDDLAAAWKAVLR